MLLELDCPEVWRSNSKLILLVLGAVWFNLALVKTLFSISSRRRGPASLYFLSPCTFAPLLITLLLGRRRVSSRWCRSACWPPSLLSDRTTELSCSISLLSGFTAVYFTQRAQACRT